MKFTKFIIVGNVDHPAETTCSAPDQQTADAVRRCFQKGGSMHREGDIVQTKIYRPGDEVPDEVARHVVRG